MAKLMFRQLEKKLKKLEVESSKITDQFIAAGRGHERPSEAFKKSDPLSLAWLDNFNKREDVKAAIRALKGDFTMRRYNPKLSRAEKFKKLAIRMAKKKMTLRFIGKPHHKVIHKVRKATKLAKRWSKKMEKYISDQKLKGKFVSKDFGSRKYLRRRRRLSAYPKIHAKWVRTLNPLFDPFPSEPPRISRLFDKENKYFKDLEGGKKAIPLTRKEKRELDKYKEECYFKERMRHSPFTPPGS